VRANTVHSAIGSRIFILPFALDGTNDCIEDLFSRLVSDILLASRVHSFYLLVNRSDLVLLLFRVL